MTTYQFHYKNHSDGCPLIYDEELNIFKNPYATFLKSFEPGLPWQFNDNKKTGYIFPEKIIKITATFNQNLVEQKQPKTIAIIRFTDGGTEEIKLNETREKVNQYVAEHMVTKSKRFLVLKNEKEAVFFKMKDVDFLHFESIEVSVHCEEPGKPE